MAVPITRSFRGSFPSPWSGRSGRGVAGRLTGPFPAHGARPPILRTAMNALRSLRTLTALAVLAALLGAVVARADSVAGNNVRIGFRAWILPKELPRADPLRGLVAPLRQGASDRRPAPVGARTGVDPDQPPCRLQHPRPAALPAWPPDRDPHQGSDCGMRRGADRPRPLPEPHRHPRTGPVPGDRPGPRLQLDPARQAGGGAPHLRHRSGADDDGPRRQADRQRPHARPVRLGADDPDAADRRRLGLRDRLRPHPAPALPLPRPGDERRQGQLPGARGLRPGPVQGGSRHLRARRRPGPDTHPSGSCRAAG